MRYAYLVFASGLMLSMVGCTAPPDPWKDAKPGQKKILVSFPPLYCITAAVAGDKAYVLSMLTTEGPHHYEATPMDAFKLNQADLFIYNGLTLDDGAKYDMFKFRTAKDSKLEVLNVGETLHFRDQLTKDKSKWHIIRSAKPIMHDDHAHGHEDPHYWLGIAQAKTVTDLIAEKLSALDGANAKAYEQGKLDFLKKLDELQAYCDAAFKDKKNRKFVTQHDSLKYFAKNFGDENAAIPIQVKPGIDPDAVSIAKLRDKMENEGVRVIAIEPQYSPAQAEALKQSLKRRGIDVTIITLDPLETAPRMKGSLNPDPEIYLKVMRENIDKLSRELP